MSSLPDGYRAIVFGGSGGIGAAFVELLEDDIRCGTVKELSRSTCSAIDFADVSTIVQAAAQLKQYGEYHLMIDATGFLSDETTLPEKSLGALTVENMKRLYLANTIGPSLLLKHFHPLLAGNAKCVFATLSARVGSIGDNELGGWYSYRASKAALNMIVKTAAIEIGRKREQAVCLSLHPGTVETSLSDPFSGSRERLLPTQSASMMLDVMDKSTPEATGGFFAYDGSRLEF